MDMVDRVGATPLSLLYELSFPSVTVGTDVEELVMFSLLRLPLSYPLLFLPARSDNGRRCIVVHCLDTTHVKRKPFQQESKTLNVRERSTYTRNKVHLGISLGTGARLKCQIRY